MTPSSPPSYTFLDPTPSPFLNNRTSAPIPPLTTHETTQPSNTAIPNAEPNTPRPNSYRTITFTSVHPPNFDSLQPRQRPIYFGPSNLSTRPIFNFLNPQPNTEPVHEPPRTHPMITRSQSGIVRPIDHVSLYTSSISHIPKNPSHALKDPKWCNAMYDEYNALVKNDTWLLVPRPVGVNMVRSMWLFKHKFHADGTLNRYKARLVANGSSQQLGVDFDETFSPVVKPAIVRTVLSLVVSRYATRAGFYHGRCNSSLFIYRQSSKAAYLLIYVGDIILTAFCPALLQQIISSLNKEFDMTDLGELNCFLGISADCTPTGCPSTRMSTSSYCVFLGDNLLSWSAKRQHTISRSIVEAEYQGVANVVIETAWVRNLLRELHSPLMTATLVYCDNVSAVYMSANPVQHQRTKHIEIDIHFVRDMVTAGHIRVLHVPSRFQFADIFTKGFSSALFEDFRFSLSVRPLSALTAGAY
nr:NBS-containing resistance-like protein [Tanacetum cinerariifolium]